MGFTAAADAYDRFMGRYSRPLAHELIAFARLEPGARVLDVGCGPGALTSALAEALGAGNVAAADPAEQFVGACSERVPGADVRRAAAEQLPWPDRTFDATLSQLAVNFFADAPAGIAELRRVTRPGGVVAACTWDYVEKMEMLAVFWGAARSLEPDAPDEAETMQLLTGDGLRAAWEAAGFEEIETARLSVESRYEDFDDFWEPFLHGVGPAGAYVSKVDDERRDAIREECRRRLGDPTGPFALSAHATGVRGIVP